MPVRRLFRFLRKHVPPKLGAIEILKYVGPGFLVTVGFIDPGNWAANVAAGSRYGYALLWTVTLGTMMLIVLQRDAARLGIATGLCIAEATTRHHPRFVSWSVIATGIIAAAATAMAELLGTAIGLQMLTGLPLSVGILITATVVGALLLTNSYRRIERWLIGFVAIIGLSFLYEISLCRVPWTEAIVGWTMPSIPLGALPIVMSVLGAVVMPHNLFLHSEVIQSRQWNLENPAIIRRQLRFEFTDTLAAMGVGWAINSAMIIVAAAVFFANGTAISELAEAHATLQPLLGSAAAIVFAVALILAGVASSLTAAMAGGSIFAGMFEEPFDIADPHSRLGVVLTLAGAVAIALLVRDPFTGLIWSQVALSLQLPVTILALLSLTASRRVMGPYVNPRWNTALSTAIAAIVVGLDLALILQMLLE